MSITVKKLLCNYDKHEMGIALYVHYFEGKVFAIDKEKYKRNSPYTQKLTIEEKYISNNTVYFFCNKKTKLDCYSFITAKFYYIWFNEFPYEVKISSSENDYTKDELSILIKEKIYKENKKFEEIKKQVELYEKFETEPHQGKRTPIPEDVKFEVWRRDGGKCVYCGSNENLEFDHIIPFSKGGSNTARNLQLLCQNCNRHKSDKI